MGTHAVVSKLWLRLNILGAMDSQNTELFENDVRVCRIQELDPKRRGKDEISIWTHFVLIYIKWFLEEISKLLKRDLA